MLAGILKSSSTWHMYLFKRGNQSPSTCCCTECLEHFDREYKLNDVCEKVFFVYKVDIAGGGRYLTRTPRRIGTSGTSTLRSTARTAIIVQSSGAATTAHMACASRRLSSSPVGPLLRGSCVNCVIPYSFNLKAGLLNSLCWC